MATPQQLLDALRRADAAGDTEAARAIAKAYKQATAQPSPQEPQADKSQAVGQFVSDVAWPTAGAVMGGTIGAMAGPPGIAAGSVIGAGIGTVAQKFLEGAPAQEQVEEGLTSAAFEAALPVAGTVIRSGARMLPRGQTDEVGRTVFQAAERATGGSQGAPAASVTTDGIYKAVDNLAATAIGSGDTATRNAIAQQLTTDIDNLASAAGQPGSNAVVGDLVQKLAGRMKDISAQSAELARGKALDAAAKRGVKVNVKPLKVAVEKEIARLKRGGLDKVPDGLLAVQKQLSGVSDSLDPYAANALRKVFSEESTNIPEFGRYLGVDDAVLGTKLPSQRLTLDTLIESADKSLGSQLKNMRRVSQRDISRLNEEVLKSVAQKAPEQAADLLSLVADKPRLVKQAMLAIRKTIPNSEPIITKIQQKQVANILEASKGRMAEGPVRQSLNQVTGRELFQATDTLSGQKLLNQLDKLGGAEEILGKETAEGLRRMGEALARVQRNPSATGIIALRGAQVAGAYSLLFGSEGPGNQDLGLTTAIVLGPGALSRMLRRPAVQKALVQGLSTPASKATNPVRSATAQALREFYDSGEYEGVEVDGQFYSKQSPEAQQVLQQQFGKRIPQVPFRTE